MILETFFNANNSALLHTPSLINKQLYVEQRCLKVFPNRFSWKTQSWFLRKFPKCLSFSEQRNKFWKPPALADFFFIKRPTSWNRKYLDFYMSSKCLLEGSFEKLVHISDGLHSLPLTVHESSFVIWETSCLSWVVKPI